MKIVGLVGSPRKGGNVDTLLQKAMDGAKAQGAETALFYLNDLNLHGCQGCYGCKKDGKCVVKDDMQQIYAAINEADAVIIGSPIYFGRISAQLAPVMDRFFAYLTLEFASRLAKGKKYGLAFAYAAPSADAYVGCIGAVAKVMERIGFTAGSKPLIGAGLGADDAASKNAGYLDDAFKFGAAMAKGD